MAGLIIFVLCLVIAYLFVGIIQLIVDYLPWMYDDAENTGLPPSVYQHVAWQAAFLWPREAYQDIKWFIQDRRANGHQRN